MQSYDVLALQVSPEMRFTHAFVVIGAYSPFNDTNANSLINVITANAEVSPISDGDDDYSRDVSYTKCSRVNIYFLCVGQSSCKEPCTSTLEFEFYGRNGFS
jgi:hypothetical protein